jgi:PAS domain S-box-containing protein
VIEYEKGLILDSMSEILAYYSSTNLKIEWTNRAAGESVGLSLNKLVGEHCYEIWHNRNEPCDGCPVVKSFETGKPEEDERTTPDGREWYVRSYPVISEKGAIEGVVEVVQNITERKQAEQGTIRNGYTGRESWGVGLEYKDRRILPRSGYQVIPGIQR